MPDIPQTIRYIFDLDGERIEFEIDITFNSAIPAIQATNRNETYPEWTKLEKNQCACCPLNKEDTPHCPAAVRIHKVLETFKKHRSIERVELTVETTRRVYMQECDLQSSLNSMLGLQMATSGCPVVGKLRVMATFHTPFSSIGETLFRTVGDYLTEQFFIHKNGGIPDWDLTGLQQFYEQLEGLNESFSQRIQNVGKHDAISNAIVMFFASSIVVADAIDEGLHEYRDYFTGQSSKEPPMGG